MAGKCSPSELHSQTIDSRCWIRLGFIHSRQTSAVRETQDLVHGHSEDWWPSHGVWCIGFHLLLSLVCVGVRRTGRRSREEAIWDPGRDTWGLEQGSNELRVGEPQDWVDRSKPTEVDITEDVAQTCCKLHAFLVALHLGNERSEASPGKVSSHSLPVTPPLSHPVYLQH